MGQVPHPVVRRGALYLFPAEALPPVLATRSQATRFVLLCTFQAPMHCMWHAWCRTAASRCVSPMPYIVGCCSCSSWGLSVTHSSARPAYTVAPFRS